MEYNSGSNWANDSKSARVRSARMIGMSITITPAFYDKKSYYQLIVSITKCEKISKSTVEKRLSKSKENKSK